MKNIFLLLLLITFSQSKNSSLEFLTCVFKNERILTNLKTFIDELKTGSISSIISTMISQFPKTLEEISKCDEKEIVLKSLHQKDNRVIELEKLVTTIEDYPNKGFHFRDITGVIQTYRGFELIVDLFSYKLMPLEFDAIVALEPHGFIFASPLAYEYRKKLILARYKGRLPGDVVSVEYDEHSKHKGIDILRNSIKKGERVVVVDDFIATGITFQGACKLIEQLGGVVVKILSIIEVLSYNARNNVLKGYDIFSIIQYEG